jgi:hypothetical protein
VSQNYARSGGSPAPDEEPSHVDTQSRHQIASRLAEIVVPGAGSCAIGPFLDRLFQTDRAGERETLDAFLARNTDTHVDQFTLDPWFESWAELVHEHYWTSPEGLDSVGFPVGDVVPITPLPPDRTRQI